MNTRSLSRMVGFFIISLLCLGACSLPGGIVPQPSTEGAEEIEEEGPPPIEVLYATSYVDGVNNYHAFHIAGEVRNISDRAVYSVTLNFEVKDSAGVSLITKSSQPVDSTYAYISQQTLMPGETAPFDFRSELPEGRSVGRYSVTYHDSYDVRDDLERAELLVEKLIYWAADSGTVYITGELVNPSDSAVWTDFMTGVAVALVDADGKVLAASGVSGAANSYLAPAGDPGGLDRLPFYATLNGPVPNVSAGQTYPNGFITEPRQPELADIRIDSMFTDSLGTHLLGNVSNSGTEGFQLYWVSALYDADGYVINDATPDLSTDGMCLDPGESLPVSFDFPYNPKIPRGTTDSIASYVLRVNPDDPCDADAHLLMENLEKNLVVEATSYAHKVTGTVTNSTSTSVDKRIVVVVYFTDSTGAVKAVQNDTVYTDGDTWNPGDGAEVDVNIYLEDGVDINALTLQVIVIGQE